MKHFQDLIILIGVVTMALSIVGLSRIKHISKADPRYAPLLGADWHPPPYAAKEMTVTYYVDTGWPFWHQRSTHIYVLHNAGWDFVDGFPPKPDPKYHYGRVLLNFLAWIGLFVSVVFVGDRIGIMLRP